jgi:hypothetical protein
MFGSRGSTFVLLRCYHSTPNHADPGETALSPDPRFFLRIALLALLSFALIDFRKGLTLSAHGAGLFFFHSASAAGGNDWM